MAKKISKTSKPRARRPLSEEFRQRKHLSAHRIQDPSALVEAVEELMKKTAAVGAPKEPVVSAKPHFDLHLLAEVATCLWYLKTKYFKRDWKSEDAGDEDPRTRRALGRLYKTIDALKKGGIEIEDRTGERYRSGTDKVIKPIQFQPTPGLTFEKVMEMVVPIVNLNGHLIQPGEAFIAAPDTQSTSSHDDSVHPEQESPASPASAGSIPAEAVDMPPRGEEVKSRRTGSRTKDGNIGDKTDRSDRKGK